MHHDSQTEGDDHKPQIILHYNATKSGMDNLDHLLTMYSCRGKVNRWPVVLFGNCIDVGAVTAFVCWVAKFPEWISSEGEQRRHISLLDVGKSLVLPHTQVRSTNPSLQHHIRTAMKMVGVELPNPEQPDRGGSDRERKRCYLCPRQVDKKVRLNCNSCRQPVCLTHSIQQTVCEQCL